MNRDCCQSVSPGAAMTPPTITSPTSPSAWQDTTWMSFKLRIGAQFLHYCPETATGRGLWVRRRRRSSTSRRDLLQDVAYKALQEVELVARSRQRVRALVRRLSRRRQRVAGRRLAKRGGLGGHQP